jgi:hypothetical protein
MSMLEVRKRALAVAEAVVQTEAAARTDERVLRRKLASGGVRAAGTA